METALELAAGKIGFVIRKDPRWYRDLRHAEPKLFSTVLLQVRRNTERATGRGKSTRRTERRARVQNLGTNLNFVFKKRARKWNKMEGVSRGHKSSQNTFHTKPKPPRFVG